MSRSRRFPRWTAAALLTGAVGIVAAGCIAVPVGGYADPTIVVPTPGVVIAPPPVVYRHRHYYGGRYYGGRSQGGRYYGGRGGGGRDYGRWR
jgi:hypothetical protein